VRPAKVSQQQPSKVISFSYWSIKPWFLSDGKFADVLIITSSWVLQRCEIYATLSTITWLIAAHCFCKLLLMLLCLYPRRQYLPEFHTSKLLFG
jgi:hypothetical protein